MEKGHRSHFMFWEGHALFNHWVDEFLSNQAGKDILIGIGERTCSGHLNR
jgi:hypothetical protein